MQVRVLGPLEVVDEGGRVAVGGPKERRLLALLAAYANQVVAEERICEALWGEEPPRTLRSSLRTHVSRVRKAIGNGLGIETTSGGYRLNVPPGGTDVAEVEALATEAQAALQARRWDRAAEAAGEALSRFRGPALPELAATAIGVGPIGRLGELRASLAQTHVEARLALGQHAEVVPELEELCAAYPLREGLWAARILALYRCGRQAEALRAYQDLRQHLAEGLGLEPSAALGRLEAQVLAQDPALAWSSEPHGALPSGVVTFLLTDIEGSTALWDADATSMAAALERHDALVGEVVTAHRGTLLKAKGEGDATVSVFRRASDGAACALALQGALGAEAWAGGLDLRVRMALHTGEAHERDGDYFGPTLNRAARLRALGAGGQVLCSQATAEVIHDRLPPSAELCELGHQVLRGVSRPEQVYALWVPELGPRPSTLGTDGDGADAVALPLPGALRTDAAAPFVGRDQELDRLRELWTQAQGGTRRAVVVGGEPGVGKTRLVSEAAAGAHDEGALVLYGRCDEGLGVPYQPFAEALGTYVGAAPPQALRARAGGRVGELVRLLPEVGARLPELPPPTQADPETERYLLFEAVADLVSGLATAAPTVVVLDDLHWASTPTLLLLRHLLKRTEVPLLIVATYRDTEVDRAHPLADTLTDLRREAGIERLSLRGLDPGGVYAYLQAAAGDADLDPRATELAQALWQETEGNPFFVGEVLAHLVETGAVYESDGRWTAEAGIGPADLGLPEGVKEVIGRRLSRLSTEANRALTVASVVGPTFALRLLEQTTDLDPEALLDALESATEAGLVQEESPGTYTFAHALVRQNLYSELSGTRRLRLHRRVGEALEAAPDRDRHLEALAHHFAEAALDGCGQKAADYALAAGRRALDRLAYEEALVVLQRGLEALNLEGERDLRRQVDLLLEVADAHGALGNGASRKQTALQAVALARDLGDGRLLARAAISSAVDPVGRADDEVLALLDEAFHALPIEDLPLRAEILACGAQYRAYSGAEGREVLDHARAAVDLARRAGSPWTLALALNAELHALWGAPEVGLRIDLANELIGLEEELVRSLARRRYEAAFHEPIGYFHRATARLERGDLIGFFDDCARRDALTEACGYRNWWSGFRDSMEALLGGRLDDAERLLDEALNGCEATESDDALNIYAGQLVWLRREQGRSADLLPLIEAVVEENREIAAFRGGLARAHVDVGDLDTAREQFEILAHDDFAHVPRDQTWTVTVAILAEVCAVFDDAPRARVLHELLGPHAGHLTMVTGAYNTVGAVDRYLGMLDATLGRFDEAGGHFEAALGLEASLPSPPSLARTRLWYARMLLRRDGPGDADRAGELAALALETAEDLGMAALAADAGRLVGARGDPTE